MAVYPQKSTGEQFSLRLKAFYAALFLTLGVQLPFLPVWLSEISRPSLSLACIPRTDSADFVGVPAAHQDAAYRLILPRPDASGGNSGGNFPQAVTACRSPQKRH
jgi:hypothetical protein